MTRRIYLVAGEPSGDRLGAALMEGIATVGGCTEFVGVGGPEMEARGLDSIFNYSELSVMGIAEVVPRLPRLLRLIKMTAKSAADSGADALVTIDSPDFCLKVARRVKESELEIPVVHYVCPSLWAWRPGRAAAIAKSVDHILALLPFEQEFLGEKGIPSTFVGHPAVSVPEVPDERIAALRDELGIARERPLLAVLPGSRRSEINVLEPIFRKAVQKFLRHSPEYFVIVPAAPAVAGLLASRIGAWPPGVHLLTPVGHCAAEVENRKRTALYAADIALAASGTVVLELALANTPMVAAYDMKRFSRMVVASMLRVETVNLINLVAEGRVVPELLGNQCTPDKICARLIRIAENESERSVQRESFRIALERLGRGQENPGLRAARAVLDVIRQNRPAVNQTQEQGRPD